jgi:osmoprotectant transport system permease protein
MKKIIMVLGIVFCSFLVFSRCSPKFLTIGSADYTEQDILGNMLLTLIQEKTDIPVRHKPGIGTSILWSAMLAGEADICVEYTGSLYRHVLKYTDSKSPQEVYDISARELKNRFHILMLAPLGFNNSYTLSVLPETAAKYGLQTYSDLAAISNALVLGANFEIFNREDGISGLEKTYNMKFKEKSHRWRPPVHGNHQ